MIFRPLHNLGSCRWWFCWRSPVATRDLRKAGYFSWDDSSVHTANNDVIL